MEVNFRELEVERKFGEFEKVDITKVLGNIIHSSTNDIGFDDFARVIYYSESTIDVPTEYAEKIKALVQSKDCNLLAFVKKGLIDVLTNKE